jgi:hypothetical protein
MRDITAVLPTELPDMSSIQVCACCVVAAASMSARSVPGIVTPLPSFTVYCKIAVGDAAL